ncbi:MAG TPA: hypothetical protein VFB60_25250 [Ktedonobacteraceae bacterium]|nr:hypothetical protein [Ktedonobacteraceae bacterium]
MNDDRGEQTQSEWRSRLARERLDLSASVEETLEESTSQAWREDEQDSAMYTAQHAAHGASLIPPRLSLQSKALPAVHSGSFIEMASSMYPALPVNTEVERKPAATAQNPNLLARLAQRLTSSLAAFGSALHPEGAEAATLSAPASSETAAPSRPGGETPRIPESTGLPASHPKESVTEESAAWLAMPQWPDLTAEQPAIQARESRLVEETGTELSVTACNTSSASATPVVQSKQRLAGHTAKIRLQTANGAASAKTSRHPSGVASEASGEARKVKEQTTGMAHNEMEITSMHLPAMDVWRKEINMTSARFPVVDVSREEAGETSVRMPTMGATNRARSAVLQKPLAGTGVFEYGQMDVIVTNPAITATSVVTVMLTSNPGPVVVQYVSLQPRVGFTVHLTAPTMTRTTFNYIILEGETA